MTEYLPVADTFEEFFQRFAPFFRRKDWRMHAEQFLRGLLLQQADRRSAENVAEAVGGVAPRSLQWFLTNAPWDTEPVIAEMQAFLGEHLAAPDGVFVLNEVAIPKQGGHSIGVARQQCGILGKMMNCQIGVFLAYHSARGSALIDGQLYLPQHWTDDPAQCLAARVPEPIVYRPKPQLALQLLNDATRRGSLLGQWVVVDHGCGREYELVDALDDEGWWFLLDVPGTQRVFTEKNPLPGHLPAGRHFAALYPRSPALRTVQQAVAMMPPAAWQEVITLNGMQDPRVYHIVTTHAWDNRAEKPGRPCWLLARRAPGGRQTRYYLSNAPKTMTLETLGKVTVARTCVARLLATGKKEIGLDEYEVRSWPGWYHHMTLSLLAGAFLLHLRQEWGALPALTGFDTATPLTEALSPRRPERTARVARG